MAAEGIKIEPGACFTWCGCGVPNAVNWAGAVLWVHRQDPPDFSAKRLATVLNIDRFWFYRFSIGFDQGRPLSILDPETMKEVAKDETSVLGQRIAKEAGIKRR